MFFLFYIRAPLDSARVCVRRLCKMCLARHAHDSLLSDCENTATDGTWTPFHCFMSASASDIMSERLPPSGWGEVKHARIERELYAKSRPGTNNDSFQLTQIVPRSVTHEISKSSIRHTFFVCTIIYILYIWDLNLHINIYMYSFPYVISAYVHTLLLYCVSVVLAHMFLQYFKMIISVGIRPYIFW